MGHSGKIAAVILLLGGFGVSALAGPGAWTGSGPQGGNVQALAVSPDQPGRIYLAGAGGIFRSDDEGLNWVDAAAGLPSRFTSVVATASSDADRLYAYIGSGFFRSTDAGESWLALSPGWLPEWGFITALQVDPADPDVLMASARAGGLRSSTDAGATWTRLDPPGQFHEVNHFVKLHGGDEAILVMARETPTSEQAIFRSTDNGASWTEIISDSFFGIARLYAGPGDTVLALPGNFISRDRGVSFENFSMTPGIFLSATVAVFDPTDENLWYLGGSTGLVRTEDDGATFSIVSNGMAPAGSGDYHAAATALALKPGDPDVVLVGTEHTGFFRTPNGGASWQRRNSGLFGVNIRSLAVNPTNSSILYAGQGDAFNSLAENAWASFDGGDSWSPANAGLEAGGLRGLALDPNTAASPVNTVLYGVGWSFPLPSIEGPQRPSSGGVFKTSSGGNSWIDSGADLPMTPAGFSIMRSVVLDPSSGSGPEGDGPLQTVYVGGSGFIEYSDDGSGEIVASVVRARIYRSEDAGASWVAADDGLPIPPWVNGLGAFTSVVIQLHINPVDPQTLYATTILSNQALINDGIVPTVDNGVFRSDDGGQNWIHASEGLPRFDQTNPNSSHYDVLAMTIAPSSPEILYASAQPIGEFRPSTVFRSDNAGGNWVEVNNGIPDDIDIRWIEVDPSDPDLVYVAGGGSVDNPGSIFRSEDGGQNWVSYSIGLPPDSATVLAIDDSGPNTVLHAGTRSGVFSIEQLPDEDIDGVPDSIEGGAPGGGDGNGDGIPDSLQPEVASLLAPASSQGLRRGVSDYLTVELVDKGRSDCTRLMSVHALSDNLFPLDGGFDYPYGLLRFEIPDCPGAAVRITYHDLDGVEFDDQWGFRIYAPDQPGDISTIRWQFFPEAQADGNAWILQLADGELGDLRPANNRILFQGGPARLPDPQIFRDRFEP